MNEQDKAMYEKKLLEYDKEDKVISAKEYLETSVHKKTHVPMRSKMPSLDKYLGDGFFRGQLVVVSGKTGQGKTTFCQTLTKTFIQQDIKSLWFSYEVDAEDFLLQFEDIYLPFFYMPAKLAGKTTKWLETRIWEAKVKYGVFAVFIDHLHYLIDMAAYRNISLDIGYIVRTLKQVAIRRDMTIFLVCHPMKTVYGAEMNLGDVRDSSLIEQEADTVLYIWRNKDENESILKIAKNRKRGVIDKKIPLIFKEGVLYERA